MRLHPHARQFHAAAWALLERRASDVRVVASCVGLLGNTSGRDAGGDARGVRRDVAGDARVGRR